MKHLAVPAAAALAIGAWTYAYVSLHTWEALWPI